MSDFDPNAEADRVVQSLEQAGLKPADFKGLSERRGVFQRIRDMIKGITGGEDEPAPAGDEAPPPDAAASPGAGAAGGDAAPDTGAPPAGPPGAGSDYGEAPPDAPGDEEPDPQAGAEDMQELGDDDITKGDVTELIAALAQTPGMMKSLLFDVWNLRRDLEASKQREERLGARIDELTKGMHGMLQSQVMFADALERMDTANVTASSELTKGLRDMLTKRIDGERLQVRTAESSRHGVAQRLAPPPTPTAEFDAVALVKARTRDVITTRECNEYRNTGRFSANDADNQRCMNAVREFLANPKS